MKMAKRFVSVFLAALIVFGSFSIAASAAVAGNIVLDFEYYRAVVTDAVDENGDPILDDEGNPTTVTTWERITSDNNKVGRGDVIKARAFIDTDYAVGSQRMFWMYTEGFMVIDTTNMTETVTGNKQWKTTANPNASSAANIGGWNYITTFGTEDDEGLAWTLTDDGDGEYEPYVYPDEFVGYDWFCTDTTSGNSAQTLSSGTANVDKYDDKYWAYEVEFKISDTATGTGGIIMHEMAIKTPDVDQSLNFLLKQPNGDGGHFAIGLTAAEANYYNWNLSALNEEEMSVDNTVKFVDADGSELATYTGYINGPVSDAKNFTVPAITDTAFLGWSPDGGTTLYSSDAKAENYVGNFVVPYEAATLTAVYEEVEEPETYTVTFKAAEDGEELSAMADLASGYELTADDLDIAAEDLTVPDGKEFAYWTLLDGTKVEAGYKVTADITLIPYYNDVAPATFTVSFEDADGAEVYALPDLVSGTLLEDIDLEDAAAELPEAPEGKHFANWVIKGTETKVEAGYEVTADLVLAPVYADNTYTVTFKHSADGEEIDNMAGLAHNYELTADDLSIMAEELVPDAGKQFANWALADGTDVLAGYKVTSDLVLVPEYSDIKYTVTFYADEAGTVVHEEQKDAYTYNGKLAYPATNPTAPEGKYFDGWSVAADTAVTANMTVTPIFTTYSHVITFIDQGETTKNDAQVEGTVIEAPAEKGKADYTFAGWYTAENGAGDKLAADTVVTGAATYYAHYTANGNITYTIEIYEEVLGKDGEYNLAATIEKTDGVAGEAIEYNEARTGFKNPTLDTTAATVVASGAVAKVYYDRVDDITITVDGVEKDYEYGEELNPEVPETTEGQEFDKWVDENGDEVKVPVNVTEDMDGLKITATYKYVITFIDQGATTKNDAQAEGAVIEAPAEKGLADHTFKGWYTAENGAGDKLAADTKVTGVATYYAYYAPKTDISYTIAIYEEKLTADKVAGEDEYAWVEDVIVENAKAGEAIVYNEARTGFKAPVLDPADAVVANGITVKAYYDRVDDITITVDGVPEDYEYGEELNPAAPETTEGQIFDKWVDENGDEVEVPVNVTEDMDGLKITATYKYVITFIVDGETVKDDAQAEGAAIVAPADPDNIAGYTFGGWYTAENGAGDKLAADTKVTGAATYYAQLTIKKNALTFTDADGKTVAEYADVAFGADLNALAPEAPEVEGMTFAGWVDAVTGAPMPATMPETAATYKPTYTNNGTTKYTVETYFMDVDGNYTTKTVATTDGILGTKVTVEDKSDENVGYYLDTEKSIMSIDKLVAGTVLKAYYARNEVTVTFVDYDGITELGKYEGLYGSKIEYPDDPTRDFHTFAGWDSEPATAPVGDITITATYERVPVVLVNNKTTAEGKNVVIDRENPDQMIIYGFMVNDLKNQDDYSRYLAVEGDGYFKVVPVANGKYGTGTKIELYDNYDGALLETYFIVIYGDVDGDGNVGSNDISIMRDEALGKTSWSDDTDVDNYNAIRVLAANIVQEGTVVVIKNNDVNAVIAQVNTTAEINQATREVIYNS